MRYVFPLIVLTAMCGTEPEPPPVNIKTPSVGMRLIEFNEICGPPNLSADTVEQSESDGRTTRYFYSYSDVRAGKSCLGVFTFRNETLESINTK